MCRIPLTAAASLKLHLNRQHILQVRLRQLERFYSLTPLCIMSSSGSKASKHSKGGKHRKHSKDGKEPDSTGSVHSSTQVSVVKSSDTFGSADVVLPKPDYQSEHCLGDHEAAPRGAGCQLMRLRYFGKGPNKETTQMTMTVVLRRHGEGERPFCAACPGRETQNLTCS